MSGAASRARGAARGSASPFLRAGLPMVLFSCVGYLGLTSFVGGRVENRDRHVTSKSSRTAELEAAHMQIMAKLNPEGKELQIKPIPRPKEA